MISKPKKILYLSLVLTIPINVFFIMWFVNSAQAYNQLDKFAITIPKGMRLTSAVDSSFNDLKYRFLKSIGQVQNTDVMLILDEKKLNQIESNLPESGLSYKKNALLIIKNEILKGKLKIRGDHFYHWLFPRKSWRFKTSKSNTYNNINKLNFIIPKNEVLIMNNVAYELAKVLNLLAPDSELVNLSINGKYNGVRLMVEQTDESFLRRNKRMPGDIYKGDNIGRNTILGIDAYIFNNPSIWEKQSFNNHYSPENIFPLAQALKNINAHKHTILDLKSFASMAAFIDLTSTYHYDNTHNWILFYDNYLEKFYPIIWDTSAWLDKDVSKGNINIITSDLFYSLYQNYEFIRLKYKSVNNLYKNDLNEFYTPMKQAIKKAKEIVNDIGYSFNLISRLVDKIPALKAIDLFEKNINNQIDKIKEYFLGNIKYENYKYAVHKKNIRLSIKGNKLINRINLKFSKNHLSKDITISYLQANNFVNFNISHALEISNNKEYNLNIQLLPHASFSKIDGGNIINFTEATYDLELVGVDSEDIESVSLSFDNLLQETIEIQRVNHIEHIAFQEQLQNIIANPPITKTLNWSGEKHFKGFNTIQQNVNIAKGTTLIFEQEATLKVLGKVTAIGTADEPIIFKALDSSKPWGAFALKDERANGSVFKHVIFKDGSGDKGKLHEYTAMLSVHNVKDLVIEDCEFYDNKLTDDMVHLAYSKAKFSRTKFIRSLSDALDVDISDVIIEDCEFVNSGNDSIDLMTSNAVVINSKFSHSADKGISIGEGSKLLAINNLIENSEIGLQSKDTSIAYIYNTSFIDNNKAIDAYHKNWRYSEGGTIYVDNCNMQDNKQNATVGKKSYVVINNCQIDTANNFEAKALRKGKIILSEEQSLKAGFEQPFFSHYSNLINYRVKGVYD
jgi:hypothetical protein